MNLHRVSVLFFLALLTQIAFANWLEDFLTRAQEEEEANPPIDCVVDLETANVVWKCFKHDCVVDWETASVVWKCFEHCECRRHPIIQRPRNGGVPCPDRRGRTQIFCQVGDTKRYRSLEYSGAIPEPVVAPEEETF
eukprot:TRINITY_DN3480_c0_g1_i6.p1 TRINITY_DN3480_c0_g1~~TRINITY_DN3480_c0_g1_i6.p1  ORF type:complete len:137 (+),score=25.46 TRINITY_DN3480_c0_g1_i6:59-469(+)